MFVPIENIFPISVKIARDFKKLNIYWISDGPSPEEVDKKLKSIAGPLRHELSVLRLMGEIPQINFCRDKSHISSSEIDSLLKTADFGEDFVPTNPTLFIKTEPTLEYNLSDEMRKKIRELDAHNEEEEEVSEEAPVMRNDVFGLDHDRITKSVMASIDKSQKAWEMYNTSSPSEDDVTPVEPFDFDKASKEKELREEFVKFLEKRKIEKKSTPERKKFSRQQFNSNELEEDFVEYEDAMSTIISRKKSSSESRILIKVKFKVGKFCCSYLLQTFQT